MFRIILLTCLLAICHASQAQIERDPHLQAAFAAYMQQKLAPVGYHPGLVDTMRVILGDLNSDGLEDAVIDWQVGSDRSIAAFLQTGDGYAFGADDPGVWIRKLRYVFTPYKFEIGSLRGTIRIEEETHEGQIKRHSLAPSYPVAFFEGSLLNANAANLLRDAREGHRIQGIRNLVQASWPMHKLGGSGILWNLRFESIGLASFTLDERHRYLTIFDTLGSEIEEPTTLTAKAYRARDHRWLLVLTWQAGTNAEWNSQDHWAAFWDQGHWIPATDIVFPPLDGRLFFDPQPDDSSTLSEQGWQTAIQLSRQEDEVLLYPTNDLETLRAAYPELVAKMKTTAVRLVWNRHRERFEVQP